MVHSTVQCLSRGDTPTRAETFPGLHTPANYCSLINQHILINRTRMRRACVRVYVRLCARSVSGSDGMDLSGQQTHACRSKNTHRHTRCSPLLGLHHVRGMFAERILCADRTPRKSPRSTQAASHIHTDSVLPSLNLWLHTTKLAPAREEGLLGGHKAPSVTQTVAVSGY